MKKAQLIMMGLFMMLTTVSFGQTDFKWDYIDTTTKTQTELYTITKTYIGESWKSAKDVIQVDDKEGGVILVKGLSIQNLFFQLNDHRWTFSYTVKFMFKDNKYRVVIENVYCQSARCQQYEWAHMPVSDSYPEHKGLITTGVNEERYLTIMKDLKNELQSIIDGYNKSLTVTEAVNEDW